MDSTEISKIIFKGPVDAVKRYRWKAIGQLRLLDEFMHFQGLKQHKRRIVFPNGVVINCLSSFGLRVAEIQVPKIPIVSKEEKIIIVSQYLFIVYGNPEEYIDINYALNSPVFIPENVSCSDGGTGTISTVIGNRLYGSFIKCWEGMLSGNTSHASASVDNAIEAHYERKYKYKEIFENTLSIAQSNLSLSGPMDQSPCSNTPAEEVAPSTRMWTKTLGGLVVTAFIFYPSGIQTRAYEKWAVCAQFNGVKLTWQGKSYYPSTGFARCRLLNYDYIDTYIGFDLWTEQDIYYIGLLSDQESNYTIWKVNPEENSLDLIFQRQTATRAGYGDEDKYNRLVGYGIENGVHKAYWARIMWTSGVQEEELLSGATGTLSTNGIVDAAIYNPIVRQLSVALNPEGSISYGPPSAPQSSLEATGCFAYYTSHASNQCGSCYYESPHMSGGGFLIYGGECTGPGWPLGYDSWSSASTIAWIQQLSTTIWLNYKIGKNPIFRGATEVVTHTRRRIRTQRYHGYCSVPIWTSISDSGIENKSTCSTDRAEIEFTGWIWGLVKDELAYRYKELKYESVFDCCNPYYCIDGGSICAPKCAERIGSCPSGCYAYSYESSYLECQCKEFAWTEESGGVDELLPFVDPVFPYDHTWASILLQGTGRKAEDDNTEIEHSGAVIYKIASGLYLYGLGAMNLSLLDNEVLPIRAFFTQHQEKIEQEIEV